MRQVVSLLLYAFLFLLFFLPGTIAVQAQSASPSISLTSPRPLFKRTDVTPPAIRLPSLINPNSQFATAGENLIMVVVGWVVNLLSLIGGLVAFGFALYGGLLYLTAGPNPAQAQQGKSMIIGAVVGVLIMSLAYLVVLFIRDTVISVFQ